MKINLNLLLTIMQFFILPLQEFHLIKYTFLLKDHMTMSERSPKYSIDQLFGKTPNQMNYIINYRM